MYKLGTSNATNGVTVVYFIANQRRHLTLVQMKYSKNGQATGQTAQSLKFEQHEETTSSVVHVLVSSCVHICRAEDTFTFFEIKSCTTQLERYGLKNVL